MSNKYAPPTVFIKMGGDGKPMREDGPSTPSNVKILGPRNGGRQQQGRPQQQMNGRPQQQIGRPAPQRQQQFAPPQQQQLQQPQLQGLTTPQLTLCRTLVHGYLKKGLDEIGEDNLKLSAITLDALDNMLAHAAAIAPPPAPRAAPVAPPARRPQVAAPQAPPDFDPETGEPIDIQPAPRATGAIAPRRVVRAGSSIGMPTGLVPAPEPEIVGAVIDVPVTHYGEVEIDDQPAG